MWYRFELKNRAKLVLSSSYWKAFVASMVILLACGGGGGSSGGGGNSSIQFRKEASSLDPSLLPWIGFIIFGLVLFALAFRVLLGYALEVGGRHYFIRSAEGNATLSHIGRVFQTKAYGAVVLTMLWRSVLLVMWTLLFIIPGIIKAYAYRMVPYILADNPNIGINRAIELSSDMTGGEKFNIFVLDLSFLGWYLLGTLAFLIGTLFVKPYDDATNAELYLVMRQKALQQGLCSYEELYPANRT